MFCNGILAKDPDELKAKKGGKAGKKSAATTAPEKKQETKAKGATK